jgi:hypothetical protein
LWRSGRSGACSPSASPRSVKVSPSARAAWVSSVIPMTGSACLSSKVEQRATSAIFFVWLVTYVLKIERRAPGFFFWPGRRRVSWHQANEAVQTLQTGQTRRHDARSRLRRAASGNVRARLPHHRQPCRRGGDRAGCVHTPARCRPDRRGALPQGLSRHHYGASQPQSVARSTRAPRNLYRRVTCCCGDAITRARSRNLPE